MSLILAEISASLRQHGFSLLELSPAWAFYSIFSGAGLNKVALCLLVFADAFNSFAVSISHECFRVARECGYEARSIKVEGKKSI